MQDAAAISAPNIEASARWSTVVRARVPTLAEASLAIGSALLLVLSFPDFDLWWLAWLGMVPLIVAIATTCGSGKAFVLGWLWGTIFFYGTCWWLTYPMIHYAQAPRHGHIPSWLAYLLLLLPVFLVAIFPALFSLLLSRIIGRFGLGAVLLAPVIWVSAEWARYAVTGQVWNAIGYSQAFHPSLIQSARWGGVYAITFIVVTVNATIAFALMRRTRRSLLAAGIVLLLAGAIALASSYGMNRNCCDRTKSDPGNELLVLALQPNVPMEEIDYTAVQHLLQRHLELSEQALTTSSAAAAHRVIIWPESPMNFSYSRDPRLRDIVGNLARTNRASVLLNSLEPAANGGEYNSAILVNEQGQKVAQYDKIRLMPFGEYVPLPRWLPGASSVRGIVGEFTPGSSYTLMPLGALRAGVFICIEAAHPAIARSFTNEGADLLINISNDGYLGPTAVMRQHLANAIFRAVENDRPLVRVTNSGISAYIDSTGAVSDGTLGFQSAVRTWTISKTGAATTFYTRHGDLFVYACALLSVGIISASFRSRRFVSGARA